MTRSGCAWGLFSVDYGGGRVQCEKGGSSIPPNEVALAFKGEGEGEGEGAVAIVVHPAAEPDHRVTCADFGFWPHLPRRSAPVRRMRTRPWSRCLRHWG